MHNCDLIMMRDFGIPAQFTEVGYVASRIPGIADPDNLAAGANCQVYAYEFLRFHGKVVPDFRSSELWSDARFSCETSEFQFLDLMFYHNKPVAYGAHVGIYLRQNKILHLCKQVGHPEIRLHEDFLCDRKYACFIGAKRFVSS